MYTAARTTAARGSFISSIVTNNGFPGIRILGGGDNSSHNHVEAKIEENTLERNRFGGILIRGGFGRETFPAGGTSTHNVVDVSMKRNTLKNHDNAIGIDGGSQSIANNNQVNARIEHNVVEGSTESGIYLAAGGTGVTNANTLDVRVAHNTVCGAGTDIVAEGGFSGISVNPVPNQGTGNVLEGEIFHNTATEVLVADGTRNETPANTATVKQFKNDPCS